MKNRKALAALAVLMMFSAVFTSGCGNDSGSTPDETSQPTSASTSAVAVTEIPKVESTTVDTKETKPYAESEAQTEAYYENVNNQAAEEEAGICNLIADDKTYTANVGDIVTYVFNLKTPDALEDFQATTNYDSSMLELVDSSVEEMFPIAGKVVVCNTELQNMIKYNAVKLEGMDFTKGGEFIKLKFRILDSGSTAVSTTLEYMDSVKSEPYVSDYRILGDIEYSEEILN